MPITQDRMIEVVSAARRFADALKLLQSSTVALIRQLPLNPTLEECLEILRAIQSLNGEQLTFVKDHETIAAEERHFQTKYKKNKRTAEYARRKAATGHSSFKNSPDPSLASAVTYQPTAPTTMRATKPLSTLLKPQTSHSDSSPFLSPLTLRKIEIDQEREALGLPPLYPDPTNDAEPIQTQTCQQAATPQAISDRYKVPLPTRRDAELLSTYHEFDEAPTPDPDEPLF